MSQEEEKLIEEFRKYLAQKFLEEPHPRDTPTWVVGWFMGWAEEHILKAYRAGKLAGFENVISILPKKECQQDPNCTCSSRIMNLINFLIEEEKKKL